MAHDLGLTTLSRFRAVWRGWPAVARIAVIYAISRLATTALMLQVAAAAPSTSRFGPNPSLGDFVLGWDAQWYWTVAVLGYPSVLPREDTGTVAENAWAFMPVYAHLSNAVGLGVWGAGALVVSLVAGFVACFGLHGLLRRRLDDDAAMWSVALFASAPLAALFQVGYAEALFLALLMLALWALAARRWWWLYALVPLMGYTRPGILAFALMLGLYGLVRWFRRRSDALSSSDIVHILALGALAVVVGFSWQIVAGIVTGVPDAYLQTELAWRRGWLPGTEGFVPFEGWLGAAPLWFSLWGLPAWTGYVGLALIVSLATWGLLSRRVRALGPEVQLWSISYAVYLLAVFFPQSSTFRLLVPLSPLWGAAPRSRSGRIVTLLLCLLGQWVWITAMYGHGNTFWQIP